MEAIVETKKLCTPNAATHTLIIDVVNKDASVKRIEVSFCSKDIWSNVIRML